MGARQGRGTTTSEDVNLGRGTGRRPPGLIPAPPPPDVGTSFSGRRRFCRGRAGPRRRGRLTRRRRGEAACFPAECPSPWPRRCRGHEAAGRIPEVPRSARAAALRRPPAPPPCTRAPTAGSLGPCPPSAAWSPVPHRPLRLKPGVQWDHTARPSRGGGRAVTSRGGARRGGERRGCGPGSAHPLADAWTWAVRMHNPGRGSARSTRLGGANLGPSCWMERLPQQSAPSRLTD